MLGLTCRAQVLEFLSATGIGNKRTTHCQNWLGCNLLGGCLDVISIPPRHLQVIL